MKLAIIDDEGRVHPISSDEELHRWTHPDQGVEPGVVGSWVLGLITGSVWAIEQTGEAPLSERRDN